MRKSSVGKSCYIICSILIILSLAGCGGNGTSSQSTAVSSETIKQSIETTAAQITTAETQSAQTTAARTQPPAASEPQPQVITEADAKQIALNHANVSESDAIYMQVKLERDHGRDEYDVEFYVGNTEYGYEIDAVTGEILSYDYDAESHMSPAAQNRTESGAAAASQNQDSTPYITQEQAKAAAFAHANVSEGDVFNLKIEFDQDHGNAEYDIEFDVGQTEYEYEIDAVTGDVISFETDRD